MAAEASGPTPTTVATTQKVNFFGTVDNNGSCSSQRLPDELLVQILSLLDISSLAAVTETCRNARRLGSDRSVWCAVLTRFEAFSEEIPCRSPRWKIKRLTELYAMTPKKLVVREFTIRKKYLRDAFMFPEEGPDEALCYQIHERKTLAYSRNNVVWVGSRLKKRQIWRQNFADLGEIRGLKIASNELLVAGTTGLQIWNFRLDRLEYQSMHELPDLRSDCPIAFDSEHIFIGEKQGWILKIDRERATYTAFGELADRKSVRALCIVREVLYSGHEDGNIHTWDGKRGARLGTLPRGYDEIKDGAGVSALTTFGSMLVSAGEGNREEGIFRGYWIKAWNLERGASYHFGHGFSYYTRCFSDYDISALWANEGLSFSFVSPSSSSPSGWMITKVTFPSLVLREAEQVESNEE